MSEYTALFYYVFRVFLIAIPDHCLHTIEIKYLIRLHYYKGIYIIRKKVKRIVYFFTVQCLTLHTRKKKQLGFIILSEDKSRTLFQTITHERRVVVVIRLKKSRRPFT